MPVITPSPRPPLPEPALTTIEFARAMSVTDYTVREWLKAGSLKGIKVGQGKGAQWRIPRSELERLLGAA